MKTNNKNKITNEHTQQLKRILRPIIESILKDGKYNQKKRINLGETVSKYNEFYIVLDHDERGEYAATLYDPNDKVVWDVDTETMYQLIEDGFLKYKAHQDIDRLQKYLQNNGVIPKNSTIYSARDWERRSDDEDDY